jgi:para-nitrobenzyl esterase
MKKIQKKIQKKIIALLVVLTMVASLINLNVASAAAKPTKLNWLTTMVSGDTATFSVKDATGYTITWKSNQTKIATVGKKTGLVTALKAGTAKITATLNMGKKKVTLSGIIKVKQAQSTVISTEFGKVKGIKNGKNVTWYGIPYAAEPTGTLRWSKPVDPANWSDILDCTTKAEVALQYSAASKSVVGTTDSLNLDVYTSNEKGKNLPVFVFFHGGNNQTGSSYGDLTGTDMVINQDCIVVSVNYRLGLLGFNSLPALQTEAGSTGNYGLLDMQKSLQWVKENIKQFGGNPNNITISGHSAGGRDVMVMLISPIFKGLFQKAIVSSGGMTTSDVTKSSSQIASILAPMAVEDGKAATVEQAKAWLLTDGSDVKDYLYSISSERLMAAIGDAGIRMSAFPHLYADGVTIPKEGFETKVYNDVPVIMITGSDEFSAFNNGSAYTDGSIPSEELAAAKAFGSKYGSQMYGYFNAAASAQNMVANGYQSPIYLMDCNFGHDRVVWPEMAYGSYHGVILSLIDKSSAFRSYFPTAYTTEGANQLGAIAHGYMKNFLWSEIGNPNVTTKTEWSGYTTTNSKWLVLDADRNAATATMKDIDITSYTQVFEEMEADTTISTSTKEAVIKTVLNGRWFSGALDNRYGNLSLWK